MNEKRLLTALELSFMYGVSSATIYNWAAKGMPYQEVQKQKAKRKMFDKEDVEAWMKQNLRPNLIHKAFM